MYMCMDMYMDMDMDMDMDMELRTHLCGSRLMFQVDHGASAVCWTLPTERVRCALDSAVRHRTEFGQRQVMRRSLIFIYNII